MFYIMNEKELVFKLVLKKKKKKLVILYTTKLLFIRYSFNHSVIS